MWWVWLIIGVVSTLYTFLILGYYVGFSRNKEYGLQSKTNELIRFSVVIAARNEENNIENLLQDLLNQDYPKSSYEIILVDDNSEDKTAEIAERILCAATISYKIIKSDGGKKKALAEAFKHVQNDIIVFTDADCKIPEHWLWAYRLAFQQKNLILISAPVVFLPGKSPLSQIFSLEFSSLVASGAGAIGRGRAIMMNGANMAVRREAFLQVEQNEKAMAEASGDDIFLMAGIKKKYGSSAIGFLNSMDALVKTPPPRTIKSFINQRIRWTSKSKSYSDRNIIYSALVVFVYNLLTVTVLLVSLFEGYYFLIYLLLLILKTAIDLPLLISFQKKYNLKSRIGWIFPLQIIYPFYIVFIGFTGHFLPYSWKGRSNL